MPMSELAVEAEINGWGAQMEAALDDLEDDPKKLKSFLEENLGPMADGCASRPIFNLVRNARELVRDYRRSQAQEAKLLGNKFLVGAQGSEVVIMLPAKKMSGAEAVNLAAWLVAVSTVAPGGGKEEFEREYKEAISS